MIYPKFLEKGCTIGVTAPSDGNNTQINFTRLDHSKEQLQNKGYSVIETAHVRCSKKFRSTDGKTRAAELEELIENDKVSWIISAHGGEFLMEMLSFLDFNKIISNPTWFQGYSDNTGISFTVTTNCDIATIYGSNFNDFAMEPWHKALEDNLAIIQGKKIVQTSFDYYEDGYYDMVTGLEGYHQDKPVLWRNITSDEGISMSGRLIGGCFDVILNLIGTRFDNTKNFINQYKEDGILWYLESFALGSESITRGLWQMKEAGWFDYVKGFIFGRPAFFDKESDIPYDEAVLSVLGELNVPIILEADIGHKPPQMTLVNGAIATIHSEGGKGSITLDLR